MSRLSKSMEGWKTKSGGFFLALSAVAPFVGLAPAVVDAIFSIGIALGVVGIGHKVDKNRY